MLAQVDHLSAADLMLVRAEAMLTRAGKELTKVRPCSICICWHIDEINVSIIFNLTMGYNFLNWGLINGRSQSQLMPVHAMCGDSIKGRQFM